MFCVCVCVCVCVRISQVVWFIQNMFVFLFIMYSVFEFYSVIFGE